MPAMLNFLFRQVRQRNFWLMFLATTTMTLMYSWRGSLRNSMFWDVNNH